MTIQTDWNIYLSEIHPAINFARPTIIVGVGEAAQISRDARALAEFVKRLGDALPFAH